MGRKLENALGILNGTIGDYLARTGNGLATPMTFVHDGAPMAVRRDVLARAYPDATSRVVVLLHGIMCTETVWTLPEGGDYGAFLARDFGLTPLYIRYNSGLAIADNGVAFADLLESLINEWPVPVEEILLLGFSMGGLVARSRAARSPRYPICSRPTLPRCATARKRACAGRSTSVRRTSGLRWSAPGARSRRCSARWAIRMRDSSPR